jgi:hypothetical protein
LYLDLSPLILDIMHSCHSGRLMSRWSAGSIVGLLANVACDEPQRFVTIHVFGLSSRVLPRPKVNC